MGVRFRLFNYADPFERFRIGDGQGSRSPIRPSARLEGSPRSATTTIHEAPVPRWLSTDKATSTPTSRCRQGVPCALLLHSRAAPGRLSRRAPGQGQGDRGGGVPWRGRHRQRAALEEHTNRCCSATMLTSIAGRPKENRSRMPPRCVPRRHGRRDQPARHRHHGNSHADGQEQRRDRRGHQKWLVGKGLVE